MTDSERPLAGRCLCGTVRFRAEPPFRPVVVCHCRQCAQWTGHAVATTNVAIERFQLLSGEDNLGWYAASDAAKRGFCKTCGSALFWRPNKGGYISIAAGALDPPTGLRIKAHIFYDDKSDYFEVTDGVTCWAQGDGEGGVIRIAGTDGSQ